MKHFFCYMILCMACVACTNTGTVNILIANESNADVKNARVVVACDDVMPHLTLGESDTLLLLNEANRSVPYHYTDTGDSIVFVVPVVKALSQKNFSLNVNEKRLADNLLRFRTASVLVHVDKP